MSGGSWDYLYCKLEDAADKLRCDKRPLRRALGVQMRLIARAMHDIEWVDSCDKSPGDEDAAIRSALGQGASALVLVEALANAKAAQAELQDAIADVEANGQKGADHITDTGKKGAER